MARAQSERRRPPSPGVLVRTSVLFGERFRIDGVNYVSKVIVYVYEDPVTGKQVRCNGLPAFAPVAGAKVA